MRVSFTLNLGLLAALVLALLNPQPSLSQPSNRPKTLTPQWESLFNGKDLSGWRKVGKENWVVEDGTIYGAGISDEYGYLATEKSYKDFHLSLRFKCEAGGNSGVYLHTTFEGDTPQGHCRTPSRNRPQHRTPHRRHLRRR